MKTIGSHRSGILAALSIGLCLTAVGCGGDDGIACTTIAAASLNIKVTDAATGMSICDATVTAKDGTFTEVLMPAGISSSCQYAGPYERAGTYSVTVEKAGYVTQTKTGLVVTKDVCHVMPVSATIALAK